MTRQHQGSEEWQSRNYTNYTKLGRDAGYENVASERAGVKLQNNGANGTGTSLGQFIKTVCYMNKKRIVS